MCASHSFLDFLTVLVDLFFGRPLCPLKFNAGPLRSGPITLVSLLDNSSEGSEFVLAHRTLVMPAVNEILIGFQPLFVSGRQRRAQRRDKSHVSWLGRRITTPCGCEHH